MVTSAREVSRSLGTVMVCRASSVAEGGVFSPSIAFNGGLDSLELGVSFPESLPAGVGVLDRSEFLCGERFSMPKPGVRGARSGDFSGDGVLSSDLNASV